MKRSTTWPLAGALLMALAAAAAASDWYTRVKQRGVQEAAAEDVESFEKGRLSESLHVGDCYFHLERWEEAVAVFHRLRRKPDRNYAAAATAREAEGLARLGRRAEARALFATCLEKFPEAYLDVDIPQLCRAWIAEMGETAEEGMDKGDEEAKRVGPAPEDGDLRGEIGRLESEIAALRKRLAELKKALSERD